MNEKKMNDVQPGRQVEIGEVNDEIVGFGLFVEEADLGGASDDVVGDDAFDQDGLDAVDGAQVDADVGEGFLLGAPARGRVHAHLGRLVVGPLRRGVETGVGDRS